MEFPECLQPVFQLAQELVPEQGPQLVQVCLLF
jgi:hypothetical protein